MHRIGGRRLEVQDDAQDTLLAHSDPERTDRGQRRGEARYGPREPRTGGEVQVEARHGRLTGGDPVDDKARRRREDEPGGGALGTPGELDRTKLHRVAPDGRTEHQIRRDGRTPATPPPHSAGG